jgi:3-oxoadipate enol-lactonase
MFFLLVVLAITLHYVRYIMNSFVTNDVRIAYRTDGSEDAPTVVLVNSLGTNLHMWDSQIAPLSQHFRVLRYDFRGHGASSVPSKPSTIEQFGLELLALLDTLQIERTHICGLSLGGIVALYFVSHYPERVKRAVFANTAGILCSHERLQTGETTFFDL